MSDDYLKRLQTEFSRLSKLGPDRRQNALERMRREYPELATELTSLLAIDDSASAWFDELESALVPRLHAELDAAWAPGRLVGSYRLERLLGSGGMGAVFLARKADGELKRPVALKLIPPESLPEDGDARLRRERDMLASLSHPNIAHLIDAGVDESGQPWIAMEYVDGPQLDHGCRRDGLSLEQRLDAFLALCHAVAFTHRHLIVHGDIKPANVLIGPNGRVRLLDFGIARLAQEHSDGGNRARYFSPGYAAPELLSGQAATVASDIFALGRMLEVLIADLERTPTELRSITERATHDDPDHRYQSVTRLIDDIEDLRSDHPVLTHSTAANYRFRKWLRRHRPSAAIAVLVLALIVVFASYSRYQAELYRAERDKALALSGFLKSVFASADPEQARGESLSARQLLDRGTADFERIPSDPAVQADFLTIMAHSYQRLGEYPRAAELFARVSQIHHDFNQPLDQAEALVALAETEHADGRFEPAQDHLEQALSLLDQSGSAREAVLAAEAMAKLGRVLNQLGDSEGGTRLVLDALELARAHRQSHPEAFAERLNDAASTRFRAGRHDAALALIQQALTIRRQLDESVGRPGPRTATLVSNAGLMYYLAGHPDDADKLFAEALELRRRLLPADHPEIAQTLTNHGLMLKDYGQPERSVAMLEEALAIRRAGLRPGHVKIAQAQLNLAVARHANGELETALGLFVEAVAGLEAALGPDHAEVAVAHSDYGALLFDLGDFPAAEHEYRLANAIRTRVLSPDHPHQAWSLLGLGRTLAAMGRIDEARPLIERAVAIRSARLPIDNPLRIEAEQALETLPNPAQ